MNTILLLALAAWFLLAVPLALVVGRALAQTSIAAGDHHSQTDLTYLRPAQQPVTTTTEPGNDRLAS